MGQLQDRFNSTVNMVGWAASRTGHPLARMINDIRYEREFKPIAEELGRTAVRMKATGAKLEEMENSGKRPDYDSEHKSFEAEQRGVAEDYDKLKDELKYPHSMSKEADIISYLGGLDKAKSYLADTLIRGDIRQQFGGRRAASERRSASRTTERPMTDEEALENAYRTIARKEMATQNRRNMEEYIRFFHNPDMR